MDGPDYGGLPTAAVTEITTTANGAGSIDEEIIADLRKIPWYAIIISPNL